MRNEWVLQIIGEKILLGFQGNEKFVEQSLNFVFNYEVIPSEARVQTLGSDKFKFVSTTFFKLRRGLLMEGRGVKRRQLLKELYADADPEDDYNLDNYKEDIDAFAEKYCEEIIDSIRHETFYHHIEAESFLPFYSNPSWTKK